MNGGRTYAAAKKDKRKQSGPLGANRCANLCRTDRRLCSFHRILPVNPVKNTLGAHRKPAGAFLQVYFSVFIFNIQEVNSCLSTT